MDGRGGEGLGKEEGGEGLVKEESLLPINKNSTTKNCNTSRLLAKLILFLITKKLRN